MFAINKKTGRPIVGSCETIPGTALILRDSWSNARGALDFEWDGETEVNWDGQETDTDDAGLRLFIDDSYEVCTEADIELADVHPDDEDDEDEDDEDDEDEDDDEDDEDDDDEDETLTCACGHTFVAALGAHGCPNCCGDNGPAVRFAPGDAVWYRGKPCSVEDQVGSSYRVSETGAQPGVYFLADVRELTTRR